MADKCSKDSVRYRRGAHEAREYPKMQDRVTIPLNSRETTSKRAFSNGADMDLSGDLYEKNVQADYVALAALDVNKWVDSYSQIYNGKDNDGYCYENDIKSADRLRGNPICHDFFQSTQAKNMSLAEYLSVQRQMNPERVQAHAPGFDPSLKHIPRVENMQPAQFWEYMQSASQSLQNAQKEQNETHLRRSSQRAVLGPVTSEDSYRVQKVPIKPRPTKKGGRPVPPAETDPRWNIWTLGNMDIRYNHGGVTVNHLRKALFALDKNKRSKHDYKSLKTQVIDKRNEFKESKPPDWKPTQGWWVHLEPE